MKYLLSFILLLNSTLVFSYGFLNESGPILTSDNVLINADYVNNTFIAIGKVESIENSGLNTYWEAQQTPGENLYYIINSQIIQAPDVSNDYIFKTALGNVGFLYSDQSNILDVSRPALDVYSDLLTNGNFLWSGQELSQSEGVHDDYIYNFDMAFGLDLNTPNGNSLNPLEYQSFTSPNFIDQQQYMRISGFTFGYRSEGDYNVIMPANTELNLSGNNLTTIPLTGTLWFYLTAVLTALSYSRERKLF